MNADSPVCQNHFLEPGYIVFPERPTLVSAVLGSAVSICLFDKKRKVGGMNLFLYPSTREPSEATALYGNVSTVTLVRMMMDYGSKVRNLEAYILGGAYNPERTTEDVGRKGIMVARRILNKEKVSIVSEDVGGAKGRKIVFNTGTSELAVLKVERLRDADWYPYEGSR